MNVHYLIFGKLFLKSFNWIAGDNMPRLQFCVDKSEALQFNSWKTAYKFYDFIKFYYKHNCDIVR